MVLVRHSRQQPFRAATVAAQSVDGGAQRANGGRIPYAAHMHARAPMAREALFLPILAVLRISEVLGAWCGGAVGIGLAGAWSAPTRSPNA